MGSFQRFKVNVASHVVLLMAKFMGDWDEQGLLLVVVQDVLEYIEGMREYDVPYHVRFAIDTGELLCCT